MQTFGNATGTVTMDEIKQVGGDNIIEDPQEESTNLAAQDEEGEPPVDDDDEGEPAPKPKTPAGDDDAGDNIEAQRAAVADELGYDLETLTPKQARMVEEVMAQIAESTDAAPDISDANLTELEREVRADRVAKSTAATALLTPPVPPASTRPVVNDDADPIVLDPAQHYSAEAQLYSDSMDQRLSDHQRRRAFEELREHRSYEFAKDFVRNMKSPVVLGWLRDQLLADVNPKLEQFDRLNQSAANVRTRQYAERSAIVQLSKLDKSDPDIAEFIKPSKDGQPSAYHRVMRSDPKIAARVTRLSENPEYADLPAERRAVLLEIDRIRLAHDLAPRSSRSNATASQSRSAKVKAATELVKRGSTISSAASKAAASIIAKRAAGATNGSPASRSNGDRRRFDNPDAERLRAAANKSTSIFS